MQAACGMMSQKLKALCAATALAALSACAAPSSYMGIAFAPVAAASSGQSEIQSLARSGTTSEVVDHDPSAFGQRLAHRLFRCFCDQGTLIA